jgi:hypothetical protein
MAGQRAGEKSGSEQVTFSKASAQRIADAVRAVEQGNRDSTGFISSPRGGEVSQRVRVGTYTGTWQTGQWNTVTVINSTNTVSVYNWCVPVTIGSSQERHVLWTKANGTNSVIEIEVRGTNCTGNMIIGDVNLTQIPGFNQGNIQILGHAPVSQAGDCPNGLQWYDIYECQTTS